MDARLYHIRLQSARRNFEESGDHKAYMADCVYIALHLGASLLAEENPRLKHLPLGLTAGSYGIKGLTDMVASRLSCPIEQNQSHEDFLSDFCIHSRKFISRDYQTVKDILQHMAIWTDR